MGDRYGYSSRAPLPPPVYTIEERRPADYRYVKRRDLAPSESSWTSEYRRYTVEDPPDGGTWAWLVVLACGILHLCNELVFYLFYDTIVINQYRAIRGVVKDTYTEFMVFEDIRLTGEIVAACVSVFVGYRVVAAFGSICVGAGFLAASFVDPSEEIELMNFLVGFLGGIGCSFWRFAAYVAVMEYFKKHRMAALILSGFGRVIGIFIGYAVLTKPLQDVWDSTTTTSEIEDMTEWETYYRCQLVPAGVAFIASLVITPLTLIKGRRTGDCAWFLRIRSTRVCRAGMLLLVVCVYFLYYLGESLPSTHIIYWMKGVGFSTNHILGALFAFACGVLAGYLLLAFWPKTKKLYGSMLWMGALSLLIGLLTLQLPVFTNNYISYVATYSVLLGGSQVMFEILLRYVIPIAFGRQYIRWIEGLLGLMAGIATIANNFIAEELAERSPDFIKNVFYFAGAGFVAAGVLAVVVIQLAMCLQFSDRNRERDYPPGPMPVEIVEKVPRERRRRDDSPPRYYHGYQYR
ncbi:uncharacterized protein LOC128558932 [Mercenaria mercenaria]|uniref:uncharacterized protein LOC128558932 n=1 Tax=Mercenaria mercenaria TaxID=6596 RepID=UPI00234E61C8|nr:uncharacterized protein LOC128558932 [Mercenaria mercenaria]